jgi:hypothetical protein
MKGYADSVNILSFTNDLGIPMIARLVHRGDRYGRDGCLTHDEEDPMLEFYDARYNHNPWLGFRGQFISRYYLSTLNEHRPYKRWIGLDLHGGVPVWKASSENMVDIFNWLDSFQSNV